MLMLMIMLILMMIKRMRRFRCGRRPFDTGGRVVQAGKGRHAPLAFRQTDGRRIAYVVDGIGGEREEQAGFARGEKGTGSFGGGEFEEFEGPLDQLGGRVVVGYGHGIGIGIGTVAVLGGRGVV